MKVKVGVIGTGAIGIEHINRINHKTQGAFVTAVSDINVEAASKIAEEIGAQFFKTGEELIASEEVEVVVVTSWDPTHENMSWKQSSMENTYSAKTISNGCRRMSPNCRCRSRLW